MGLYRGQRYSVIISATQPSWGQYWVCDNTRMKLPYSGLVKNGSPSLPTPNDFPVQHGGARVSIFYRFVETAAQHAKELNIQDEEMADPCHE